MEMSLPGMPTRPAAEPNSSSEMSGPIAATSGSQANMGHDESVVR